MKRSTVVASPLVLFVVVKQYVWASPLVLFVVLEQYVWASPLILGVSVANIPVMWYISHHNNYTHSVLYSGWAPVIGAMIISRFDLTI